MLGLVLATAAVGLNLDAERDPDLLPALQLPPSLDAACRESVYSTSAILAGPRRRLAGAEAASSPDCSTGAAASAPTAPTKLRAGWLKAAALTLVELLALIVVSIFMGLGLTLLIIFGVIFAMLLWIVVVAPLQYFLYLVCGGPARTFKNAMWTDEGLPKGSLGFVERIRQKLIQRLQTPTTQNHFKWVGSRPRRPTRRARKSQMTAPLYGRRSTAHVRSRSRPRWQHSCSGSSSSSSKTPIRIGLPPSPMSSRGRASAHRRWRLGFRCAVDRAERGFILRKVVGEAQLAREPASDRGASFSPLERC